MFSNCSTYQQNYTRTEQLQLRICFQINQYLITQGSPKLKKKFFFTSGTHHFYSFGLTTWHVGSYFPNQGSNPHPLYWQCGALTTGPPVKSLDLNLLTLQFLNLIQSETSSPLVPSPLLCSILAFQSKSAVTILE